jgi:hypothetical protein
MIKVGWWILRETIDSKNKLEDLVVSLFAALTMFRDALGRNYNHPLRFG